MASVPAVKQNPFGIGMGFAPPDSLFKPDFLIEKKYLSLELHFDQLQHSMFSNAVVLPCSHLAKKVQATPTVASTCGLAAGSSCDVIANPVDFRCDLRQEKLETIPQCSDP